MQRITGNALDLLGGTRGEDAEVLTSVPEPAGLHESAVWQKRGRLYVSSRLFVVEGDPSHTDLMKVLDLPAKKRAFS